MASISIDQPTAENPEAVLDGVSIDESDDEELEELETTIDESYDDEELEELETTILETKCFRINCHIGTGKRLKVNSTRVYEWDEVVEVVVKFIEMVESYPGITLSMVDEHITRVWEKWISTNYRELNVMDFSALVMVHKHDTLEISFEQFQDLDDSDAPPPWQDEIAFRISKKSHLKTLKDIAIEAAVSNLKNSRDVEELKLPSSLSLDLKHAMSYYCEKFPVPKLKDLAATVVVSTLDKMEDAAKLNIATDLPDNLIQALAHKFNVLYLDSDSEDDDDEDFSFDRSDRSCSFNPELSDDGYYGVCYNSDF